MDPQTRVIKSFMTIKLPFFSLHSVKSIKMHVCRDVFGGKYLVDLPEFLTRCSYHHAGFQQSRRQMVRHH